jgi:hypothetical protein
MSVIIDGSAGVTTNAGGSVNPSTTIDGINYSCRAWVNFNGTGTVAIRGSGNVTSITDNGTGDYTVNFTTAMSDANYSFLITPTSSTTAANGHSIRALTTIATTSIRFIISNSGAVVDVDYVQVGIFR